MMDRMQRLLFQVLTEPQRGGESLLGTIKIAVLPIAKVFTMCFLGFLMASKYVNILPANGRKLLNGVVHSFQCCSCHHIRLPYRSYCCIHHPSSLSILQVYNNTNWNRLVQLSCIHMFFICLPLLLVERLMLKMEICPLKILREIALMPLQKIILLSNFPCLRRRLYQLIQVLQRKKREAMIPCILLALGGNLVDGPGSSKLGARTTAAIIFGRLLLVPPTGLGIVMLADKLGFLPPDDKMFRFVLLLQHTMPTSVLSGAVASLRGCGREAAAVLFWVHIFAVFSMAGWIILSQHTLLKEELASFVYQGWSSSMYMIRGKAARQAGSGSFKFGTVNIEGRLRQTSQSIYVLVICEIFHCYILQS
ncbi:UNVERIFIED_CONTAM: protein PIN-LIKES 6 [Sesamum calycinum]|uniref:Protein PIN-LIKES 6 n=1 Tax=Sesamum calycinum TaxID=2727403 RepID=A0AAW2NXC0_9LAMI